MTTTGLAKTENDLGRSTEASSLRLVDRMTDPRPASFRIHISDNLFDDRTTSVSPAPEELHADTADLAIETSERRIRGPLAIAAVAGLVIGFLVGRQRK